MWVIFEYSRVNDLVQIILVLDEGYWSSKNDGPKYGHLTSQGLWNKKQPQKQLLYSFWSSGTGFPYSSPHLSKGYSSGRNVTVMTLSSPILDSALTNEGCSQREH